MLKDNLLAPGDMCVELGVSLSTVRNMILRGELEPPNCRIGKKTFWDRDTADKAQQKLLNRGRK